ncbi:rhomboid family intramembrane serine protease [Sulfurovum sp. zt1-1]|uniref:Rhomboid family intramembrane serine protease n=1 Tax=Sulfurovum zhangzhouensis TaxID=3019067 RepID=A0ABT7QX73_9BACT|nr:rhomboid family intramembrane serine protease [Sulfurovum zhangzhouensis]MDM5271351.1 rhomboid family intramembrane serine protease [Sulfurovum zhangzhouensis]
MRRALPSFKVTYTLILLNLLVYVITALFSADLMEMDTRVLVTFGALYGPLIFLYDEWWRLFTAMFLHGGMTHILMNMFSLYIVGRPAEIYFDKRAYLAIYFFSGLIGAVTSLAIHPQSVGIGASGAIFGVFGALAGFFLIHRERIGAQTKVFMKNFGVIIALNIFLGLSIPAIDMSAHIGGLMVGFIGGMMLSYNPRWLWFYSIVMVITLLSSLFYLQGSNASVL